MPTETRPSPPPSLLARVVPWPVRVLWLVLPLVCGPTYARALDGRVASFETGVSVTLWVVWGLALGASLIPRPITLTAIRVVMPAAVGAIAWAAVVGGEADWLTIAGVAISVLAAGAALLPTTGDLFVNGSSYGDERRMPLRPPGTLLLGPIEAAWLVTVVGACAGPLLLLAHVWLLGLVVALIGAPLAALALRALHRLSQRWIVFVPAGLVLHDAMAVADPVLFARRSVRRLGAAPADTDARDLTLGALGLALEVRVDPGARATLGRMAGGDQGEGATLDAVLFTPSQPGELLREAARRRLPVA